MGVLEPVDYKSQSFRTFLTEQYDVDCSMERVFQSRYHVDVLTETLRWMLYFGNYAVDDILSLLPPLKPFGPTSLLPRKLNAPKHPYLQSKERARKAGCLEPATGQKTVKWQDMSSQSTRYEQKWSWSERIPASSHPASSWEVFSAGDNVTARGPVASAPCGTRTPPNIDSDGKYNRFAKERSKREVCCDSVSCRRLLKGDDKGDFVDPQCQVERENREKLWKQGHLDATWFCVSCLKAWPRSVDRDTASLFKQRQDNKSAFMARSSP